MKHFIKSLIVFGAVFAVSAPAFAGAPEDRKQLTTILCNAAKDTKRDLKDDERKSLMNSCLESKKTDALMAHYPAAKTIWVKVKYVSDPPGAVLYIATPENRKMQTILASQTDFYMAEIADATKSLSDPRWKSEKEKEEGPGSVIKSAQKEFADTNVKLKELENSAAAIGVRLGYTPFTVEYPLDVDMGVKADQKQLFVLPATLRWASGATASANIRADLNRIDLLKAAGTTKTFTLNRPDNVPGRVADEEFALKVKASDREKFGQDTPSCRKEAAAVEKENQAIQGVNGNVSDADFNKFESDEIAYASRCLPTAEAALIKQSLLEMHMKIDAINARQQPTITIEPSRPSMEELIMQQPTQPPVSNSIHCRTKNVNGTVYTDCN